MSMNKESHMESPRTANSLASFIPSNLHESQDPLASQLSPSAHSSSSCGDKHNTPLLMHAERKLHAAPHGASHAPQLLQQQVGVAQTHWAGTAT